MRFILFRWGQSSLKIDFCKLKFVHISFFLTFFVQWRQLEIGCILFSLLQHLLTQEQSRLHPFLEKKLSHLLSVSVFPQFSLSLSPFLSSTFSVLFNSPFPSPYPLVLCKLSWSNNVDRCYVLSYWVWYDRNFHKHFNIFPWCTNITFEAQFFFPKTLSFFTVVRFCCHWMVVGFPAILRPPSLRLLSWTKLPTNNYIPLLGARWDSLVEFGEFCSYVDNLGEKEPQWRVLVKIRTRK